MKFTYSSGQRPLDGYTIKRGVGKGGFGEVYFALSDGGKEVALKLIRGQADIELRGIRQCLNLKHPNLVALYDVRTDVHGEPWVVMEYVAGETLSAVINRHPRGLPQELVKQWFPALARAVGHLHDHGIVHRDLKPANIFLENGILKVGDYGLSKSISSSRGAAQTQSVGTVHYMAPEIASGNYNKSIDIYALGVILYEMLTGQPPFDGESAQEVMMKHLMSIPDLTKLPGAFKPVIAKALAKDPNHRHATVAELVTEVDAAGGPVPVAQVVQPVLPVARPKPVPVGKAIEIPVAQKPQVPVAVALPALSLRDRLGELAGSMALSALFAVLTSTLWAAIGRTDDWVGLGSLFFLTVGVCWSVLIPSKYWSAPRGDEWGRRLVMMGCGALVGLLALWLDGWTPRMSDWTGSTDGAGTLAANRDVLATGAGYISYFGLALGVLRWWRIAERRRDHWFSFFPVLSAGVWALVLLVIWPWPVLPYGAAALVMGSMIVQWVSPWQAPPPPLPRRMRLRRA